MFSSALNTKLSALPRNIKSSMLNGHVCGYVIAHSA